MRIVEIRLLEGPNVYRLEPVVKVELAIGRGRPSRRSASPARGSLVQLGRPVPAREWPDAVADVVAWARRLRTEHGENGGPIRVHRAADPGRWVVTWPWRGAERTRLVAEAAVDLAGGSVAAALRIRLTAGQERSVARWAARIAAASATPPGWVRDADRRVPVVSVTGTNGKSTVTRLITHILRRAGRRVGTTTSDGILVDERLVEPGDWTGPAGAAAVLGRDDVDVAVLETARGGILLRGVGYESNDASVFTNVSADHLDLNGIHTLAELAEVKATVCRITRPTGRVVLNADDPLVAAAARRVRAPVAYFSLAPARSPVVARHRRAGGLVYGLDAGRLIEVEGDDERDIVAVDDVPIALRGLARHNVANALAAAAGARGLGATLTEVASGLRGFRPTRELSPGRLNLFRLGPRVVILDFAHNEAGTAAILAVAAGLAGAAGERRSPPNRRDGERPPVTAIVGTAGDRPDELFRGIGRLAAQAAGRVAIKETLGYLRGRDRSTIVALLRAGIAEGGGDADRVPVYESEVEALETELARRVERRPDGGPGVEGAEVVVIFCHEQRAELFALLARLGARELDGRELDDLLSRSPATGEPPRGATRAAPRARQGP